MTRRIGEPANWRRRRFSGSPFRRFITLLHYRRLKTALDASQVF
jgi:hypothetical protein